MPSALAKGTLRDAKKKNPQEIRKPLPPVPASKPDYKQRLFAEAVKVVFPRDNGNEKPSPHQQPHNLSAFEKPYPEENERNPQATEKSLPPHIQHGLPAFEKLVIQNGPAHQPELHNPVHTAPSVKAQHCVTPDHRHLGQRKPVQGVKPVDAAAAGKAAFAKTQQGHSSYVRRKPAPGRGLGESSALAKGSLRQPGGKVQKSTPKAEVEPWKNDELDHEEHGGKQANNHAHTNLHIQNPFGGIFQSKSIKNESKANTCVRVSEHDEDMVEADDTEEQKSTPHSRPVTAREKDPEFAFFKFGVDTPPAKQRPAAAESSQSLWPRPHLFKKGTQKKASKADGPAQARPEPIPWAASCLDEEPEGTKDDSQPWWAEYHRRLEDAKRDDVKKAKAVAKSHISRPVNGTQVFAADRFNPVHYDKTTPVQTKHLHEDPEQGHDEPKRETAWGDFVNPFKHKEHRKPEGPSKLLNVISNKTHTRTESSHKHSRSHSSNTNVSLALHIMNKLSGSSRHTTDSDMSFACVGIDSPIVAERGAAYAALEGTEFPTCTNCGQVMIGSGRSQCVDCIKNGHYSDPEQSHQTVEVWTNTERRPSSVSSPVQVDIGALVGPSRASSIYSEYPKSKSKSIVSAYHDMGNPYIPDLSTLPPIPPIPKDISPSQNALGITMYPESADKKVSKVPVLKNWDKSMPLPPSPLKVRRTVRKCETTGDGEAVVDSRRGKDDRNTAFYGFYDEILRDSRIPYSIRTKQM